MQPRKILPTAIWDGRMTHEQSKTLRKVTIKRAFRLVTALIAFTAFTAEAATEDPFKQIVQDWMICEKASDCVVEPGDCGYPTAVNKNRLDGFLKYVTQNAEYVIQDAEKRKCIIPINPIAWANGQCHRMLDEAIVCKNYRCGFNDNDRNVTARLRQCIVAYVNGRLRVPL